MLLFAADVIALVAVSSKQLYLLTINGMISLFQRTIFSTYCILYKSHVMCRQYRVEGLVYGDIRLHGVE